MMKMNCLDISPCPTELADDQIRQFQKEGYLAFSNVLTDDQIRRSKEGLAQIARALAANPESYESRPQDKMGATYTHKDSKVWIQLEVGNEVKSHTVDTIEAVVRKYMRLCNEAPIFKEVIAPGSAVMNILEGIVGKAPILFQDMALVKPALVGSEKPWHQDNAYFSVSPLNAVVGVWIALDDAGVENGCMHVIPGGHEGGPLKHFHSRDCEIAEGRLDVSKAVPVPIPAGGAMFFYGLLPHETPPNRSPQSRRALQFHFRSATSEIVDKEIYDRIFAETDGTPASCAAAK